MSSDGAYDDDVGEEYEVERILAERVDDDGVTRYLVKWKDYPDEQCMWEPFESFNTHEVLQQWKEQKESGDVLDEYDLQRIQESMDRWQAQQYANQQAEPDSDYEETYDAALEPFQARSTSGGTVGAAGSNEPPPLKRQRLIPDAPPLGKKKGIARPMTTHVHKLHRAVVPAASAPAPAPLHRPKDSGEAAQLSSTMASKTTHGLPPNKTHNAPGMGTAVAALGAKPSAALADPPQHFFAPDLSQRKRRQTSEAAPAKKDMSGKSFKNLRHMNNARKKQREELLPALPTATFAPGEEPTAPQAMVLPKSPKPRNKSFLFFDESPDEDDADHDTQPMDYFSTSAAHNPAVSASRAQQGEGRPREVAVPPPDRVSLANKPVTPHADHDTPLEPSHRATPSDIDAEQTKTARAQYTTSPSRAQLDDLRTAKPADLGNSLTDTQSNEASTPSNQETAAARPRRNSLFNRQLSISAPTPPPPSETNPPKESTIPLRHGNAGRPPDRPSPQPSTHHPLTISSTYQTGPSLDYISPPGQLMVSGSRRWMKGDLVLDISVLSFEAGIKLLHVPWNYARPLLNIKEKGANKLPILFLHTISRQEYEKLSKRRWFSYFACGSVEPFTDTVYAHDLLAKQLEDADKAALWYHPDDDLMLLLYSLKSMSWQGLPQKPVRAGKPRLQIVFRQKFEGGNELGLVDVVGKLRPRHDPGSRHDVGYGRPLEQQTIPPRDDERRGRRSRRSSIASETPRPSRSGSRAPSVERSPGSQLMSELQISASPRYTLSADAMEASPPSSRPPRGRRDRPMPAIAVFDQTPANTETEMTNADNEKMAGPPITSSGSLSGPLHVAVSDPRLNAKAATSSKNTADTFAGLDKEIQDLAWSPHGSKLDSSQMLILLVYSRITQKRLQEIKQWLINKGQPSNHIIDIATQGSWSQFVKATEKQIGAIIFDKRYPLALLKDLSKTLEREHIFCWEMDYEGIADKPLPLTKLFPAGSVKAFVEGSFVHHPEKTLYLLKAFRKSAVSRMSPSKLVIPPHITTVLRDQEILARDSEAKKHYSELIKIIEDMDFNSKADEDAFGSSPSHSVGISVVKPSWRDVYHDIPENDLNLTPAERVQREKDKDSAMIQYFSAWAAMELQNYRKFQIFIIDGHIDRPDNCGHIRLQMTKGVYERMVAEQKRAAQKKAAGSGPDSARSRSRSRADGTPRTPVTPFTPMSPAK